MDNTLLAGLFGLLGSVVGGLASYVGSKKASEINIDAQKDALEEKRKQEEDRNIEMIKTNAKLIYLDIVTAIHEGFQVIKKKLRPTVGSAPALIPINNNYSQSIAFLSSEFNANELILINKLYGMIEKIRADIIKNDYIMDISDSVRFGYSILEVEVFKENYSTIIQLDAEIITKDYLLLKLSPEYKSLIEKLSNLSGIR